ncbi:MAG: response regulator [Flavobacteriaceae bacterium]
MKKPLSILLIEDDLIEIMKFNRTIATLDLECNVKEAKNGEEALNLLSNRDQLPDIILLDLNMPKISGLEFLKILKKDSVLKYIPTIILTTSINHKEILECYKIGIAGYITKPLKFEDYISKITKTLFYWNENELISV